MEESGELLTKDFSCRYLEYIFQNTPETIAFNAQLSNCWFGLSDVKACVTDLPVFLSLGEGLAVVGLILTVLQLNKELNTLTLRVKPWWQRNLVWFVGAVGLILLLFSAVMRGAPVNYFSVSPALFEIGSFVLLLSGPLSFYYFSTKVSRVFSPKMSLRAATQFFNVTGWHIYSLKPERIDAAVELIMRNLPGIVSSIKSDTSGGVGRIAVAILNQHLSHASVIERFAVHDFNALYGLLQVCADAKISARAIGLFIHNITRELYKNPQSHFYRQRAIGGDGSTNNLMELVFEGIYFIEEWRFYSSWSGHNYVDGENVLLSDEAVEVFLSSIDTGCATAWTQKHPFGDYFFVAFGELGDYCRTLAWAAKSGDSMTRAKRQLKLVGYFLARVLQKYADVGRSSCLSDFEASVAVDSGGERNVIAVVTGFLEIYLEAVSSMEEGFEDEFNFYVSSVFEHICTSKHGAQMKGVRDYLLKLSWAKIEDNIERGTFPPVLKVYIHQFAKVYDGDAVGIEIHNRLVDYLETLAPKIENNATMCNRDKTMMESALLPKRARFNRATSKFEWAITDEIFETIEKV